MEALVTLASSSSSWSAFGRGNPCGSNSSNSSRFLAAPGRIAAAELVCRWNFRRVERLHVVSATIFCSEVRTSVRKTRRRTRNRPEGDGFDVEREIFKFMQDSGKPNVFPSKEELIAAGRSDLVEAAIRKGGWLTVGWDCRKSRPESSRGNASLPAHTGDLPVQVNGSGNISNFITSIDTPNDDANPSHSEVLNGSVRTRRVEEKQFGAYPDVRSTIVDPPAEILLTKESSLRSSEQHDACQLAKEDASGASPAAEESVSPVKKNAGRRQPRKNSKTQEERMPPHESGRTLDIEATHERWRRKRRKDAQSLGADNTTVKSALDWIQDMVHKREQYILDSRSKPSKEVSGTNDHETPSSSKRSSSRLSSRDSPALPKESGVLTTRPPAASILPKVADKKCSSISKEHSSEAEKSFNTRLRNLETKLLATRAALKSGRASLLKGEDKLMQVQRKTSEDLAKAADSLEFKENEIMYTRAELRRTRAQVTVLQTKFAVELAEARKSAEEKQVRLDKAEKALKMLRMVRIVWPNAASHVLLTGSFDGWTNKIKMERSGAGVFVTTLHLYPGRYEIKFIVDGTWRVDPCRPITYAEGIENNVLVVT